MFEGERSDVRRTVNLVLRLRWGMAERGGAFGGLTEVKRHWGLLKKPP